MPNSPSPAGPVLPGSAPASLLLDPRALLAVAAQGPLDPKGRVLHDGDVVAQLALTLANVAAVLAASGLEPADLAQLRICTTDLDAVLDAIDTVHEFLDDAGAAPAMSVVEVTRLPVPRMTVQVDALAVR